MHSHTYIFIWYIYIYIHYIILYTIHTYIIHTYMLSRPLSMSSLCLHLSVFSFPCPTSWSTRPSPKCTSCATCWWTASCSSRVLQASSHRAWTWFLAEGLGICREGQTGRSIVFVLAVFIKYLSSIYKIHRKRNQHKMVVWYSKYSL